jgi:hypothetical protein
LRSDVAGNMERLKAANLTPVSKVGNE